MKDEANKLEELVGEIDYLFQEGVVISQEDQARIIKLAERLQDIMTDSFLIVH